MRSIGTPPARSRKPPLLVGAAARRRTKLPPISASVSVARWKVAADPVWKPLTVGSAVHVQPFFGSPSFLRYGLRLSRPNPATSPATRLTSAGARSDPSPNG